MATDTDTLDLGSLRLTSGEGRHMTLGLRIEPLELGGHTYQVARPVGGEDEGAPADQIQATLDISRMTGNGYALHLAFPATLHGPCMRCLEPAEPQFRVDVREVSAPGEGDEELESPYMTESTLDVSTWAHDSLALALPATLLCQPDCLGLCPTCGTNLNTAGPEHVHEPEPDSRWAALADLKLETPDSPES
jgi:uncharacterized protein